MSYALIRDGLHVLRNAFDFAHPAKPTKGFLSAELAKLKAMVDGLPDDEAVAAAAPTAPTAPTATPTVASPPLAPAALNPQGSETQKPSDRTSESA